jgi:ubiquinone/menaquinone biosynthesis C-methylase UbiE
MTTIQYVSPVDNSSLNIADKCYIDRNGNLFPLIDGVPNFIYPAQLPESDALSLSWYKNNADTYDTYLPLTFETFGVSEQVERERLLNALELSSDHAVLEIGAGSGRDSINIASRLGVEGKLFVSDISYDIFKYTVQKFNQMTFKPEVQLFLANGYNLPLPTHSFDRVFHFGGINTFGDVKKAFREMVRVCKPGGRVVVGDENMPVWLRNTEFGKVLMNSNPLYKDMIPFDALPIEARNVKVEWFIGGVFYFLSFDVGTGEPYANLDFEIPGIRGGTHRTRYYGQLEGVEPEVVNLARRAREKSGVSMNSWLNRVIREAAQREIEK